MCISCKCHSVLLTRVLELKKDCPHSAANIFQVLEGTGFELKSAVKSEDLYATVTSMNMCFITSRFQRSVYTCTFQQRLSPVMWHQPLNLPLKLCDSIYAAACDSPLCQNVCMQILIELPCMSSLAPATAIY